MIYFFVALSHFMCSVHCSILFPDPDEFALCAGTCRHTRPLRFCRFLSLLMNRVCHFFLCFVSSSFIVQGLTEIGLIPEASLIRVHESDLSEAALHAILETNADRFLAG